MLRDLEQIDYAKEARFSRQLRGDIREADRRNGVHHDLTFFHTVPATERDNGVTKVLKKVVGGIHSLGGLQEKPLPPDRKRKQRGRTKKDVSPKTGFDLRTESYKLFGVDLT